jgi:cytidylate kinase
MICRICGGEGDRSEQDQLSGREEAQHRKMNFFGPDQDELAYSAYHMVLETTSWNQGSELSSSTMIPRMTVVADLTRSED